MTIKTRLYRVVTPTKTHLVEALNQQRAIAHVARKEIKEVFALAKRGVEIETAGVDEVSDETRTAVAQEQIEA